MSEQFAIAVEWPDEPRPYLVHLRKPYFVAEARRHSNTLVFVATLTTRQFAVFGKALGDILPAANKFFSNALGLPIAGCQFLTGKHGREYPQYLMAQTLRGKTFIVEPDHPSPLVAVTEPCAAGSTRSKLPNRFDTVTQWRLAQMRKYFQQFTGRERESQSAGLVVPAF
ncbi:MAG TPA: hypothetical protein VK530_12440 [Candidatus Acidoferrum sp.]|nr:hypothetical protein [Candidatus Acidoferrum sp.]